MRVSWLALFIPFALAAYSYIEEFGRVIVDPPLWYRVLDTVSLPIMVGGKIDGAKTKEYLSEFVGDHDMTKYVATMRTKC